MVIEFKNRLGGSIEILVEPAAEFIDLKSGETANLEFKKMNDDYDDSFVMVMEEKTLVVYELRQSDLVVRVNGEIKYTK